jgi:hypothetical protein
MSSTTVSVFGYGPFEFTDSDGKHVSIPLTALTLANNQMQSSNAQWSSYLGSAPAQALWKYMLAEGLLSPMPSPAPFAAMVVRAANVGTAGNNIAVSITVPPPSSPSIQDPTQLPFTIQVTETDTYTNQTAATIANTLKTANALVQVVESLQTSGIPEPYSGPFMGSPDQISVMESGSPGGTLFVLGPRIPGPDPADIYVTVNNPASPPGPNPEGFTLQASWTSPILTATLDTLASVISELGYEITVSKPSSGAYSLPQGGSTTLTGGTATGNASATLYTSLP